MAKWDDEGMYEAAEERRQKALVQYEAKAQALQDAARPGGQGLHWTESERGLTRSKILGNTSDLNRVELPAGLENHSDFMRLLDPDITKAEAKKILKGYDFDHKIELQLGGLASVRNGQWLHSGVNRSVGAQVRWELIRHQLADSRFTMGDGQNKGSKIHDVEYSFTSDRLPDPDTSQRVPAVAEP